ncbi:MAG: hypothetical protein H6Q33_2486, partial [Deltaproteobacteria bacterium]|nr:hypothetical protein [Deltaproteobacteria bacterium]
MNEQLSRRQSLALLTKAFLSVSALAAPAFAFAQNQLDITGTVTGRGGDRKGLARIEFSGPSRFVVM